MVEIDASQILRQVALRDGVRVINKIREVIGSTKAKYPPGGYTRFLIETYNKLKNTVKLALNQIAACDKLGFASEARLLAAKLHEALDEAIYLKIVAATDKYYRELIVNRIVALARSSGSTITFEEVEEALKPPWNTVSEAIRLIDNMLEQARKLQAQDFPANVD